MGRPVRKAGRPFSFGLRAVLAGAWSTCPPVADQVPAPRCLDGEIAGNRQHRGQQDQANQKWLAESVGPCRHGLHPASRITEIVGRRCDEFDAAAEYELADTESRDIQRHDGEGVGVEGGGQRQRQVDAKDQAPQRRTKHLEGARNQSAEQPGSHCAGSGMAIQMPQPWMQQRIGERRQPAVAMHSLVAGKKASNEFAHDPYEF